jgi:hypothetical protein
VAKTPSFVGASPSTAKHPRFEPTTGKTGRPVWKIGQADFGSPWCPSKMQKDILLEIIDKLKNFERTTWLEIEKGGSHFIPVNKIVGDAQRRLQHLRLDDTSDLFSLRLSSLERLWGLRSNDVFSVLWWDPNHQVCPAPKRYT